MYLYSILYFLQMMKQTINNNMKKVLKNNNDFTTTVRFDKKQKDLIEVCAKLNDVSKSRVIQQAVNDFFHK